MTQRTTDKTEHRCPESNVEFQVLDKRAQRDPQEVAVSLFRLLRPQVEAEAVSHRPVFRVTETDEGVVDVVPESIGQQRVGDPCDNEGNPVSTDFEFVVRVVH